MTGIFDSETTSVLECNECELQFLDPMMSDEEEAEYYRNYYENQKTRDFRDRSLSEVRDNAVVHYEQYSEVYTNLIKDADCILDIGCGSGGFIKFITQNFPDKKVTGVERSESNLQFLRDKKLNDYHNAEFYETLEDLPSKDFDLVVALGVLEHVKDSVGFISSHVGLLAKGGRVAYSIPHPKNPLIEIYEIEEFKKFIYMKQHYYEFSEKSLEILADKSGCIVDQFDYMQVWSLDNHLSWMKNRKPTDFSYFTNLLSPDTLEAYNKDLIKHKFTDIMLVTFKTTK